MTDPPPPLQPVLCYLCSLHPTPVSECECEWEGDIIQTVSMYVIEIKYRIVELILLQHKRFEGYLKDSLKRHPQLVSQIFISLSLQFFYEFHQTRTRQIFTRGTCFCDEHN